MSLTFRYSQTYFLVELFAYIEVLKGKGKGNDAGDSVHAIQGNANTYGPYGRGKDKGNGKRNIAGSKSKGKGSQQGIGTQAYPGAFMSFECGACERQQALYCNCCGTSVPTIPFTDARGIHLCWVRRHCEYCNEGTYFCPTCGEYRE